MTRLQLFAAQLARLWLLLVQIGIVACATSKTLKTEERAELHELHELKTTVAESRRLGTTRDRGPVTVTIDTTREIVPATKSTSAHVAYRRHVVINAAPVHEEIRAATATTAYVADALKIDAKGVKKAQEERTARPAVFGAILPGALFLCLLAGLLFFVMKTTAGGKLILAARRIISGLFG